MSSTSQPVVVGLSGGLGNQIFQYAAGRSLSFRLGVPLVLDLSWFGGQKERQFSLSFFSIKAELKTQYPWLSPRSRALVSRLLRRWSRRILGLPVWREPHFHYSENFAKLLEPVYLEGYWQSERYFLEASELLREDFALVEELPANCEVMLQDIQIHDSICVHVRRGDYLSNPVAAQTHGTVPIEYYKNGVSEICACLNNPKCYVFSDDPEWARKNLFFNCPMAVVEINGTADAHLDLMLMASCNHFVIANSSLSWWGAWLGRFHQKQVISPKQWFLSPEKDTRDLLPDSWLRR